MMSNDYYPDTCLIIFARAPIAGLCKTRLIPVIGEQGAAELQQELIDNCVKRLCEQPVCETQLWCTPDTEHECFTLLKDKYRLKLYSQWGDGLGQRMNYAIMQSEKTYKLIIGTDIPSISSNYVRQAIEVLHSGKDAVIGPAEDGGYVLLGIKGGEPELFNGIEWGSRRVFEQTCSKMSEAGLAWQAIGTLWDVDEASDLERYRHLKLTDTMG